MSIGPAIAHVVRVRREEHVLRERICRVVPREKALELLLLLRGLGTDHFSSISAAAFREIISEL